MVIQFLIYKYRSVKVFMDKNIPYAQITVLKNIIPT